MPDFSPDAARDLLTKFKVNDAPLFIVGTFDTGVTVYSQQVRALNLVWAAVESETLAAGNQTPRPEPEKVAVVGAGFAGLTVAAALLAKGVAAEITLFEQRDTLLPLQQGSDSRWLHPRIYDWPRPGSDASVAMLPVLNWMAARASDVVVQVLSRWRHAVRSATINQPRLYCNTRHLQIHESGDRTKRLRIEWVGEERNAEDGTAPKGQANSAIGMSQNFDFVVLAVGFGLERDGAVSYWRNETLGQPALHGSRRTYLVSGQGDGAMIDLLRIRISQYRQDRILDEIFSGRDKLLSTLDSIHHRFDGDQHRTGLFSAFENMSTDSDTKVQFDEACDELRRRLRRDTDAVLRLKVRKLSELFEPETSRISFQNKLLVFLLYKCGGFVPSTHEEGKLIRHHGIAEDLVVRRHGTFRDEQLQDVLSGGLYNAIKTRLNISDIDRPFSQSEKPSWPGGYFDIPGPTKDSVRVGDEARAHWRKEYLPGTTELLATAFCSAIAGFLLRRYPADSGRLRVTLHRAMLFGDEELLQQICDYQGTENARGTVSAAGRTFPATNGTIGLAYRCRRIVRSIKDVNPGDLNQSMLPLKLHEASRNMSQDVGYVLAVPLLEPESDSKHTVPFSVVGVLYIDSTTSGYFISDEDLGVVSAMADAFLAALVRLTITPVERIRNIKLADLADSAKDAEQLPPEVAKSLELIDKIEPPRAPRPLQLNFDYSDFNSARRT